MGPKVEAWLLCRKPWQLYLLTFLCGCVGALALPPLYLWPALVVMFCGMMILWDCLPAEHYVRRSMILGWWLGFGYFTTGLYWISASLWVDIERFWWVLPFSLFGLPVILAAFIAPVLGLTTLTKTAGKRRVLVFTALWVLMEWVRGWTLSGFPWNLVGSSLNFSNGLIQGASLFGAYGLSFLAILTALALPYAFLKGRSNQAFGISTLVLALGLWTWGEWRLDHLNYQQEPQKWGRIVQPNIPQTLKWDPEERESNFRKLMALTVQPSKNPLDFIIWPESAIPFFLEHDHFRREFIAHHLPPHSVLLTGSNRRTPPGEEPVRVWNSVLALASSGEILGSYDKFHLVPFGEYFPMREFLGPLNAYISKMTPGSIDFTPGVGPETLTWGDLPSLSPLVCYEVIFPGCITNHKTHPQWILNVTNDGWYGDTAGPYQHLESARLRSVEEGVPLVRAANTGISAVFDAAGRRTASLDLNQMGNQDFWLPPTLQGHTLFSRFGNLPILILSLVVIGFALLKRRKP